MANRTTWNLQEDITLITRRAAGKNENEIGNALSRTAVAVIARLQYHGAKRIVEAQRVVREGSFGVRYRSKEHRAFVDPLACPSIVSEAPKPEPVIAPQSLTAWICGDPAPGRSALDQQKLKRTISLAPIWCGQ